MCTYSRDSISEQLGTDLIAHVGERIIVETLFDRPRGIYPDVRVVEHGGLEGLPVAPSAVATAEPLVLSSATEPLHQPYVEIIDIGTGKVITVIEFLSPTNKVPGEGQEQYIKQQRELFNAEVSLVEVDLVRTGEYVLLANEDPIPLEARIPYRVCVFRGWRWGKFEYYPLPLRQRLPAIRIPLRKTDPDAVLDLQPLIDQAYRNGGYARLINYSRPCVPPLSDDDANWAQELVQARR